MRLAAKTALKSGCIRAKRGVVAVRDGKVLASAHNRVWPTEDYCQTHGCVRDKEKLGLGQSLEKCDSIHAEANLIAQAARKGIDLKGAIFYSTCLPCSICARLVVGAGIKKIFYLDKYGSRMAEEILSQGKVELERVSLPGDDPGKRLRDTEGQGEP